MRTEGIMAKINVFSTDTDDGVISVIGKKGKNDHALLRQIRIGNAPRGSVKFTAAGRGFVSNTSQNTISEIDPVGLEEVRRIEVGHGPRGLGVVPGDKYLLVSNSGSDTLSIVDLELNSELRQIPIGRDPRHMAITADGACAYVCVWGEGVLAKVDISALRDGAPERVEISGAIDLGRTAHPYSAAIEPSGRRVFVANTQAKYASVVDIATDQVTRVDLGAIGGRAVTFSPDRRFALISVETVSRVAVVELETLRVTRQIPVGPGPRGLTIDAGDDTMYVTNFARNTGGAMASRQGPATGMEFGPNTLTVVDLSSAPLDSDTGEFSCTPLEVGYGPCSVAILDVAGLPERADASTASARH
jgi:YVTN family beta-propeller protein